MVFELLLFMMRFKKWR